MSALAKGAQGGLSHLGQIHFVSSVRATPKVRLQVFEMNSSVQHDAGFRLCKAGGLVSQAAGACKAAARPCLPGALQSLFAPCGPLVLKIRL
jgi:hypothetical protein